MKKILKKIALVMAIGSAFVLFCELLSPVAHADQYDLIVTATQGPAFRVVCGTSATPITHASSPNWTQIECGNLSTTPIFIGDSNVDTVATSAGRGWPICTDASTCLGNVKVIAANNQYCRVASGTVILICQSVRY